MQFDPRTVARNIPGMFDEIFPQLTRGLVAHLNSRATNINFMQIPADLFNNLNLQHAMLFELGCSVGEQIIENYELDWESCFRLAVRRQSAFYDSKIPDVLSESDKAIAEIVGKNIANTLFELSTLANQPILLRPKIPGLEWITSGEGDFSIGRTLIEIKCTNRRFSAPDYRQVAIYWLLSYAASLEGIVFEWKNVILLNPRLGNMVHLDFDGFINAISSGRTKIEILQRFISLVGSRAAL